MTKKTTKKGSILLLISFISIFGYAQNSTSDLETWSAIGLEYEMNKKINFELEQHLRLDENSSEIKNSFNILDRLLEKKKFTKMFKLKKGEILILNNKYMAHGRTKFYLNKSRAEDARVLARTWIN